MHESEIASLHDTLLELLRGSVLFKHLPESDLMILLAAADLRGMQPGEVVVSEGEPASSVFLIVEGEVEVFRRSGTRDVPIAIRVRGDVLGEMSLLTGESRSATVRARTAATIVDIPCTALTQTVLVNPRALRAVLQTVVTRLRDTEAHLIQHQKVVALGTMATGIAHELNNPAAALRRSVDSLREAVSEWERQASALGSVAPERWDELRNEPAVRSDRILWLDPLDRDAGERELSDWMADQGVVSARSLAPILADAGWDPVALEYSTRDLPPGDRPAVISWLATGQHVYRLLHEMTTSATTISEIVAGVKAYTRLDEAPVQQVDIHAGIDQSLALLQHKLRSISVRRDFADELPSIQANAVELNQAWTNLIDNAADALDGSGDLTIRTALDGDTIIVEVRDNGPGIPDDVRSRLFEPFFTTKPPGKGQGLGLSLTWSIIRRHNGDLQVESQPGRTSFLVRLPVSRDEG